MKTIVLGLGNTLLGDDGVGIHTLRRAAEDWQAVDDHADKDVSFVDGGTLSFTLTEIFHEADNLIVIDAAQLDSEPGTVRVFEDEVMDTFVGRGKYSSVHEVSLAELFDMARLIDTLPVKRALVGIQPQDVDWAEQPTPAVNAAIPLACQHVRSLLEAWRG
ncbi:MAG: HyaD/HybD family hydrogenase maturation endopeptidase [Proteobacteria bacterium]|jgi:hydrogenase maturation protease|nr:HyaD/HybD family hydrogenase maturation endopeptidase [Pseudomonadota bacterium]